MKTNIPDNYAERIKFIRHKLGLTQVRLAELMGVSFASVNRWENGQSRPNLLAWRKIERVEVLGFNALLEPSLGEIYPNLQEASIGNATAIVQGKNLPESVSVEGDAIASQNLISPKPSPRSFTAGTDISFGYESRDEKVVMTGLYIREMLGRGLIQRVLIIAPGSSQHLWEYETRTRFNLAFKLLAVINADDTNPFKGDSSNLIIANIDVMVNDRVFSLLCEPGVKPYDVVILDEAHSLTSKNGIKRPLISAKRRQVAEALAGVRMKDKRWQLPWRARHLLLLSARTQRHYVD